MSRKRIDALEEICGAAQPTLSPGEQRAGIMLLHELTRGAAVSASRLARVLDTGRADAETLLRDSSLTPFVHTDAEGRVDGFLGLSTIATHHRFVLDGRPRWAWCAQDSLFLPELLDETARVESHDPETGDPVRLTVSPTGAEATKPDEVAVSMVLADAVDLTSAARIIKTCCHLIFFFASRASGDRWVAAHPGTELLSLDEAFDFGRRRNARLFGHALARRTHASDAHEVAPGRGDQ